jgi:hypothetical protein
MIYGIPNVLKMSETSAGMKTRRVSSASSAVVELSRSKSFILLQAERGAMAGKYICASSIRPYVLIDFSILQSYKKIVRIPNVSSRKRTISNNKSQQVSIRGFGLAENLHFSEKMRIFALSKIKAVSGQPMQMIATES